jgi:hypothetical protein
VIREQVCIKCGLAGMDEDFVLLWERKARDASGMLQTVLGKPKGRVVKSDFRATVWGHPTSLAAYREVAGDFAAAEIVEGEKGMSDEARLSNRLQHLACSVPEASRRRTRPRRRPPSMPSMPAGCSLRRRTRCQLGTWLPFLKQAGLNERRAQRLMTLPIAGGASVTATGARRRCP